MNSPPAEIGMPLDEVDTPALLVDLDAFEHNLRRLADEVKASGIRLRPHAKTHKCAVVGQQQVALGAVGLCCQKVSEAEAMVNGGISDVLVSNQVVGTRKIKSSDVHCGTRQCLGMCRRCGQRRRLECDGGQLWSRAYGAGGNRCHDGPLRGLPRESRRSSWQK